MRALILAAACLTLAGCYEAHFITAERCRERGGVLASVHSAHRASSETRDTDVDVWRCFHPDTISLASKEAP